MEGLVKLSNQKVNSECGEFRRYLLDRINWNDRLIAIKGARGVGKTTLMIQSLKERFGISAKALYISLDDIYFQGNKLVDLAIDFISHGGTHLYIDEVHKYENWSLELKNLYDNYSDLHIVFTGSSILEIYKSHADLSRRAVTYELYGLSFREYLELSGVATLPTLDLDTMLKDHTAISLDITRKLKVLKYFDEYLENGYYPFFKEGLTSYHHKINNVINLIIETDIPMQFKTEYQTIYKLKKLLYILAQSVPYQPNISKLSTRLETSSRSSTLLYIDYLQRARLLATLRPVGKGNSYLSKPDKIYLDNPNLLYTIVDERLDKGNLRETFFINQLAVNHEVNTSKKVDFIIDEQYSFEVGGRNKNRKQTSDVADCYFALDDMEHGLRNKIPLWLFGLMY